MLEKKNTSLAKPLRVSSQCIPLFLEFSGTVFSLDRHIFPATSLSLLQHIYCSCTWMNVLQGADIAYGLYCVSRHISQCGPVCVGTAPTLFPHCSLPAGHSSEQLSVLLLLCCCVFALVLLLKRWKDLRWGVCVWNDLLGSWRKEPHGSLCCSVVVLFHNAIEAGTLCDGGRFSL